MTTDEMNQQIRELDYRVGDGVEVRLLWSPADNSLRVAVHDSGRGATFEVPVGAEEARDAFDHPFAYAAFRGVEVEADGPEPEPEPEAALR
jgi:hypothetical protein